MDKTKFVVCFAVFVFLSDVALAQRRETFAERPAKRQETIRRIRERTLREKAEARKWAAARSLPLRRDDGMRMRELMAVRNGRPLYYATFNANAAISTAASQVRQSSPYNVDGSGVVVGVWDGGLVLDSHVEFSGGRIVSKDFSADDWHATHVGGTIAASGENPFAKGMAPASTIHTYDWNDDVTEMANRAAAAPGPAGRLYLSNHSYGYLCGWDYDYSDGHYYWHGEEWNPDTLNAYFGRYVQETADWDGIVYDAPYFLPFKAAGNDRADNPAEGDVVHDGEEGVAEDYDASLHPPGDSEYKGGYDTITPIGAAKNIMTVGAVEDAVSGNNRSLADANMTFFSSWGPADDGRIKPDIVANGYGLNSCGNDDDSNYIVSSGTSMATPNACGSAALLIDYYDDRFPGQAMLASTLKGLIIHTADDLGNPGPDYSCGWGLMDTLAAARMIKELADGNSLRISEKTVYQGGAGDSFDFVGDGYEPIRVTLCWTDPPGIAGSGHDDRTAVLVNDLDLKVAGPDGIHYPYRLSYADPAANATATGENNIDNVEQVYISTPIPGTYTVTVDYDGVLADGEQTYSLLVSGDNHDSDADGMSDYWENAHFSSPTGAVASADADGDGADNLTEYVSGHDPLDNGSTFAISGFNALAGGSGFTIDWLSSTGRIYNISWSTDLAYPSFVDISGDLPYPTNSYTDAVERAGTQQFYRVEVRLDR